MQPNAQIPLDLSPDPTYGFDNLIVSACNQEAVTMVRGWQSWPAPILYLTGSAGSGKTHIGQAWAAMSRQSFIDDAPTHDEASIFAQMNRALNGEIDGLLLAGPPDWMPELPDLASRLRNTPRAIIGDHDDAILEPIVRKLFEDKGRAVSADLVAYLLKHHERSVDALRRVTDALDAAAQAQRKDLTKNFAAKTLKG